jgi:tetratricopeptide (TPR) repeat protein
MFNKKIKKMKHMKFLSLVLLALTMTFGLNAQSINEAVEQFNKGHEAFNAENYQQAIVDLEAAYAAATAVTDEDAAEAVENIKTNCKNLIPYSYQGIANSLASEGKLDEAIEYFNKTVAAAEKYGNTDITKESITEKINTIKLAKYISDEDWDNALEFAKSIGNTEKVEQINKVIGNNYLKDAQEALKTKSYQAAIDKSKKSLEYNPDNVNAYNFIGTSSLQLKQYKNAAEAYEKCVSLGNTQVFYNLAVAYQQSGNNAKACQNYKKVTGANKANADIQIKAICK